MIWLTRCPAYSRLGKRGLPQALFRGLPQALFRESLSRGEAADEIRAVRYFEITLKLDHNIKSLIIAEVGSDISVGNRKLLVRSFTVFKVILLYFSVIILYLEQQFAFYCSHLTSKLRFVIENISKGSSTYYVIWRLEGGFFGKLTIYTIARYKGAAALEWSNSCSCNILVS